MRILIVRTSALGDVVHALPVLTALRRELPAARIGWVIERGLAPLLEGRSDLDELIPVDLRSWRGRPLASSTWRQLTAFLGALDSFAAEVVLDLMGNHKAGVIGALTLADRRIGLARRHRREPSSAAWISEGVEPLGLHAVDRALSVLPALGIPGRPVDFGPNELPGTGETTAEAPHVVLLPGAGWANKRYPMRWWGEVASRLGASGGWPVRVVVGPGEAPLADEVVESSGGRAVACPTGPLSELASVLQRAALVVGGDTGPLHLADALGAPVLCLMGPTDPARNGPYIGGTEAALWKELPCSFCHKRFDETKACLLEIPPQRVAERALELIGT